MLQSYISLLGTGRLVLESKRVRIKGRLQARRRYCPQPTTQQDDNVGLIMAIDLPSQVDEV